MKRAIVTGATGFIGSWLTQELLNNDIEVTIIVRDKKKLLPEILNNRKCFIIEKDIMQLDQVDFKSRDYDICYHTAWKGVAPEEKDNIQKQMNNVDISMTMLEIANQVGTKRFCALGTVAEYCFCEGLIDVRTVESPQDIYGAVKVAVHHLLEVKARQLGIPFNWVMLSSVFGPRRLDNNIITYTIRNLLCGESTSYGKLNQTWDFLYVKDAVRAIRLIGMYGKEGKTYGVGSGQYKTLREYIEIIKKIMNVDVNLGIGEKKDARMCVKNSCVDIKELLQDTGFSPAFSFEEGIEETIQYIKFWGADKKLDVVKGRMEWNQKC